MSLLSEIKEKFLEARKSKNEVQKDAYSTLIGEIELETSRSGVALPDDRIFSIIRKAIANNQVSITAMCQNQDLSPNRVDKLKTENQLYNELLPQTLSAGELEREVWGNGDLLEKLANASNDGQATGLIVKYIKSLGKNVDGNVAKEFALNYRSTFVDKEIVNV